MLYACAMVHRAEPWPTVASLKKKLICRPMFSARGIAAIVTALLALATSLSFADEGHVVLVHDGDSLTVLVGGQTLKVRLADIDAPDLRQPYGPASKESLEALCFNAPAKTELTARDRYGRAVGKVECGGIDASAHQVPGSRPAPLSPPAPCSKRTAAL
jgi:endonuclease YncB( thermonuclease family)